MIFRSRRVACSSAAPKWNPQNVENPVVRARDASPCRCLADVSAAPVLAPHALPPPRTQVMPSPSFSPTEAVDVQLRACSANDEPWTNHGLQTAYEFAVDAGSMELAPYFAGSRVDLYHFDHYMGTYAFAVHMRGGRTGPWAPMSINLGTLGPSPALVRRRQVQHAAGAAGQLQRVEGAGGARGHAGARPGAGVGAGLVSLCWGLVGDAPMQTMVCMAWVAQVDVDIVDRTGSPAGAPWGAAFLDPSGGEGKRPRLCGEVMAPLRMPRAGVYTFTLVQKEFGKKKGAWMTKMIGKKEA